MWNAKVIQIIKTELTTRGNGTRDNPSRKITQYWDFDGNLLWENDPHEGDPPHEKDDESRI